MNFMIMCYKLAIKKVLNLGLCLFAITYFIVIFGYAFFSSVYGQNQINIGILDVKGDSYVNQNFQTYSNEVFNVIQYENLDSLKKDVSFNKLQAGYEILDDKTKINSYVSDLSVLKKITDITIYSLVLQLQSGELGSKIITRFDPSLDKSMVSERISQLSNDYIAEGDKMEIKISSMNSRIEVFSTKNMVYNSVTIVFGVLIFSVLLITFISESNGKIV